MAKQIHFFADEDDLKQILKVVENFGKMRYTEAGVFSNAETITYESCTDIQLLGKVSRGDWNHNKSYIIHYQEELINVRTILLKSGGVSYAVDQAINPNTIYFRPSGVFNDKILVGGTLSTISSHPTSLQLFDLFSKKIKKAFNRVGAFYLGENAQQKLNNGWRLVTNDKSPKEYDLKVE